MKSVIATLIFTAGVQSFANAPVADCFFDVQNVNTHEHLVTKRVQISLDTPIRYANQAPIGASAMYTFENHFQVDIEQYFSNAGDVANSKSIRFFPVDGSWGTTKAVSTTNKLNISGSNLTMDKLPLNSDITCSFQQ